MGEARRRRPRATGSWEARVILTYLIIAVVFLAVLRLHPQGMEEDLGADALVCLAWAPLLVFVAVVMTIDHRPTRREVC